MAKDVDSQQPEKLLSVQFTINPNLVDRQKAKEKRVLVLCQEDAKASCCTKDEGRSFGADL